MPLLNPIKSLQVKKNLNEGQNKVDLEKIELEFEIRTSKLVDMLVDNKLQSAVIKIQFDEGNVLDLQNSGEFDIDAQMYMQVVSSDKEALKTKLK